MKKKIIFVLFSLLSCGFFFTACQIGLGSAVDTAAPAFDIAQPAAGSIIRDAFAMSGSLTDDGTIKYITVTLTRTDGAGDPIEYSTLNDTEAIKYTCSRKEGSWSCVVTPFLKNADGTLSEILIKDGTYVANVDIADTAGHVTTQSRQFTIDNTPPVVALTRPTAADPSDLDSTDFDTYGQEFLIEGHCGDSCDRKYIVVEIFNKLNIETPAYKSEMLKADSDFSVSIASWGDSVYETLYGTDENAGSVPFLCKITGYDSAVRYPVDGAQTEDDKKGNKIEYFYMYEGVLYDEGVFSEFTTNDVYKLLSGNYTQEDRASLSGDAKSNEEVLALLNNPKYQALRGFFALNPKNNPSFLLSGKDPLVSGMPIIADNGYSITKNTSIVLEVSPGFDQIPINKDSLGFYVIKCDDEGTPRDGEKPIQLVYPAATYNKETKKFDEIELTEEQKAKRQISSAGSVYKITYKLTPEEAIGFVTGDKYLVVVDGYDKKGSPVQNASDKYAFLFTSGSAAASVSATIYPDFVSTNTENILADETRESLSEVDITLSISGDGPFKISRYLNSGKTQSVNDNVTSKKYLDVFDIKDFKDDIKTATGDYPEKASVTYIVVDKNGETATATFEIHIDNERPAVTDVLIPTTTETEGTYYKFTGKANDGTSENPSGVGKVQIKITDEATTKTTGWLDALGSSVWNSQLMFDSSECKEVFATEGEKTYEVRACDEAGNYSETYKTTFVFDTKAPALTVDSYSLDGTNYAALTGYASGKFSVKGSAADGYGLKEIVVYQDGTAIQTIPATAVANDGTWIVENLPRNPEKPAELAANLNGTYKYTVTAKDLAGKENLNKSTVYEFTIDLDAPTVEITSPDRDVGKDKTLDGAGLQFQGNVSDGETGTGVVSFTYAFVQSATAPDENSTAWKTENTITSWKVYKAFLDGSTQPFDENGNPIDGLWEGEWYLYVKATDKAGNVSVPVCRHFWVDKSAPELTTTITSVPLEAFDKSTDSCIKINLGENSDIYYFKDVLKGTAKANDTTGENVTYRFSINGNDLSESGYTLDAEGNWTILIEPDTNGYKLGGLSGIYDTDVTLSIFATDSCEKYSTDKYTIHLDKEAPKLAFTTPSEDGAPVNDDNISASGTVIENGIGIAKFLYFKGGDESLDSNWGDITIPNGTVWTQKMDIPTGNEGLVTLKIKAVDKLGQESSVVTKTINYDKNNPVVKYSDSIPSFVMNGNSLTISGTAWDSNLLKSVYISVDGGEAVDITPSTGVDTAKDEATGAAWTKTYAPADLVDGSHEFRVKALDTAGKSSIEIVKNVTIDRVQPTITITTPDPYSKVTQYEFKGTASDANPSSGLKNVSVTLFKNGVAAPVENNATVSVDGDGNWSTKFYNLENGVKYYVTASVQDAAGNSNSVSSESNLLLIDTVAPTTTLNGKKLVDKTLSPIGASTAEAITKGDTYYAHEAYQISGTVTEDNFDRIEIAVDNGTAPTPSVTGKNWSFNGIASDGTYKYTIKMYDKAGNYSEESVTVIYDNTAPTTVSITTPAADETTWSSGGTKNFGGTAKDNTGGVGIAKIKYAFTNTSTAPSSGWKEQDTTETWSISQALKSGKTADDNALYEGEWYLHIKAIDKAGNETTTAVTRKFINDQSIPTVTVNEFTANETKFFKDNSITITGTATDTNELSKVCIYNGTTPLYDVTVPAGNTSYNWTKEISIPADTLYEISVFAVDKVGRESAKNTYKLYKDQKNPEVTANPATGAAATYQSLVNLTYSGTASDANLEKTEAQLYKGTSPIGEPATLSVSAGTWNWKQYDLSEGEYHMVVTATDKAGNSSTYTSGKTVIDKTAPVMPLKSSGLYNGEAVAIETSAELTTNTTYYAKAGFALNAVVTDTNFNKNVTLTERKGAGEATPKSVTWSDSTTWSYTPTITEDDSYTYTITATDLADNKTSYTITVVYDTKAPTVTIGSPTSTFYGEVPAANGNVNDNSGIGIKDVLWSTDNTHWSDHSIWSSGTQWAETKENLTANINGEGTKTLYVKATDKFNHSYTASVEFSYDLYNPEIVGVATLQEYYGKNYNFTLSGKAGDTNALDDVGISDITISDGTNSYSTKEGTVNHTSDDNVTLSASYGGKTVTGTAWSKTYTYASEGNPLAEGNHTFKVTATDTAGKPSTTWQKDIFIDTLAPVVKDINTPNTTQTQGVSFRFTGTTKDAFANTYADADKIAKDSGVEEVYIKLNSYASEAAATPAKSTEWIKANGADSWNYTVIFDDYSDIFGTEGYKTVSVKAKDKAGNESTVKETAKFLFDKGAPETVINSYTPSGSSAISAADVSSFFTNAIFSLKATASDGYLLDEIVVKQNGTVIETISDVNLASKEINVANLPRNSGNTGAITIDASSSGSYVYTIEAKDKAGNTAAIKTITANIDKKVPTITLGTDLSEPYIQGSSKTFEFSAEDPAIATGVPGSGLDKYYYAFTKTTTAPSTWTEKVASTSFNIVQSLVSGTTNGANGELCEGQWYLWYYVKDKAGNASTPVYKSVYFDQSNPSINSSVITEIANKVYKNGSTYYFNEGLSGTVTGSDTSGCTVTYSYKIDNGEEQSIGSVWTIDKSKFTADNSYTLTLIVKDAAGRTSSINYPVVRDTTAPTVTVQSPSDNAVFNETTISARGSVEDGSGSGVKDVYYYETLTEKTVEQVAADTSITWKSLSYSGGVTWSQDVTLEEQGTVYFFVKSEDNLGKSSAPVRKVFSYDRDLPELTVTNADPINGIKGYDFTISGKAWDSNKLDYVKITIGANEYSSKSISGMLTSTPISEPGSDNWSIRFTAAGTAGTYTLASGTYTAKIKAYDKAGRESAEITRAINIDTVDPQVAVTKPEAAVYSKVSNYKFEGTASDVGLGLDTVTVTLYNSSNTEVSHDVVNVTNGNWSYIVTDLADADGYYAKAVAVDRAGNTATSSASAGVTIDTTAPATTLTGTNLTDSNLTAASTLADGATYYASEAFGIGGTITEPHLSTATYKVDDGDEQNLTLSGKTWQIANQTAGHKYTIKLTDLAGNTGTFTVTVKFDATAPTVEIKAPSADITDAANALDAASYSFRINAVDNDGGVGVKSLSYGFSTTNTTEPASWVNDNNFSDGDKYFTMSLIPGKTPDLANSKLSEGTWFLWAKAADRANNQSAVAEKRQIIIDKSAPELTVTNTLNTTGTNPICDAVTAGVYTISGTATDSNALDSTAAVVIKVDDVVKATLTASAVASGWSYDIPVGTTAGTLQENNYTVVKVIAKDVVGKTKELSYTLFYDTKNPELAITAPVDDESVEASEKIIKGTVSDEGYGIDTLDFKLVNAAGTIVKDTSGNNIATSGFGGSYALTIKGEQWYYAGSGTSATTIPLGTTEGALKLVVQAKEKTTGGHTAKQTTEEVEFYYDLANPVITETTIGTAGLATNANFTFNGTAYDSNELAKIEIKEGDVVKADTASVGGITVTGTMSAAKDTSTQVSWTSTLDVADFADGVHQFTIVATDIAGKQKAINENVTVDTTAPSTDGVDTVTTPTNISGTDWYGSRTIKISASASDTNGTGVTEMEWTTTPSEASSWQPLTKLSTGFTGDVTFLADGSNTVYVRAKDLVGNVTPSTGYKSTTVMIDSLAPDTVGAYASDGSESILNTSKLTNGSSNITFAVTATDNITAGTGKYTGVASVALTRVGSTTITDPISVTTPTNITIGGTPTPVYLITIPQENLTASGGIEITVTDKVGNAQTFTPFNIQVDKTYPTVKMTALTDADTSVEGLQINGITTISGTASDNNSLASVKLQYSIKSGSTWGAWTDSSATNTTGSVYSWSFAVDTTQSPFTNGDNVRFRVLGTDTAGNCGNSGTDSSAENSANYVEAIISQDSDRPVIRLNNLKFESAVEGYYWHKDATLYGIVSDDDGTVTSVKYSTTPLAANATGWSANIYENGMWTISNLEDGNKDIYFQVVDAAGTVFVTNTTSTTLGSYGPKIMDSTGAKVLGYSETTPATASDILKVKVDIVAPAVENPVYYISNNGTFAEPAEWKSIGDLSTHASGGVNKYLFVKYVATDSNGIDSAVASFGSEACTVVSTNNTSTTKTVIIKVDLSTFATGSQSFVITAKDNANKTTTLSANVIVDNSAPVVDFSSPKADETLYGTSSNNVRGTIDETATVYFNVTNNASSDSVGSDPDKHGYGYTRISTEASSNWVVYFDSGSTTDDEFHTETLYLWLRDILGKTQAEMDKYDVTTDMYVWVYAVDILGNQSTPVMRHFKVVPNADKPTVDINYPGADITSVGGTIRMTGGSTIVQDSVEKVYVQIDPTYEGPSTGDDDFSTFNSSWNTELQTLLSSKGVTRYEIVSTGLTEPGYEYGILANGTYSWSLNVNAEKEFNIANGTRRIAIRTFAVSATNKKVSDFAKKAVEVSVGYPIFGGKTPLEVVQFQPGHEYDMNYVTARKEYSAGMFVRGEWYLYGSIEDEGGIKSLECNSDFMIKNGAVQSGYTDSVLVDTSNAPTESGTTYKNYNFFIKVGSTDADDFGIVEYNLEATDNQDKPTIFNASIKYDNKAPEFEITQSSSGKYGEAGFEKIYQSNGTYTIKGSFDEKSKYSGGTPVNQSGFARIVMYYTRTLDGVTYLIDPMLSAGSTGKDNFYNSADYTLVPVTKDSGNTDRGLYWQPAVVTIQNSSELVVSSLNGSAISTSIPTTVKIGGLCRIDGTDYRIKKIEGTSVHIEGNVQDSTSKNVQFAMAALVIDNEAAESGKTDKYTTDADNLTNGDGDWMVEGAVSSGTSYAWNASINSQNILDGSVTVHFIAYDKAGNAVYNSFNANVSNDAPRIAGITYGTDGNGNEIVDDDEIITQYSGIYTTEKNYKNAYNGYNEDDPVYTYTIKDRLTIKGKLLVKPEIVGGNLGLGYTYDFKTGTGATTYTTPAAVSFNNIHNDGVNVRTEDLSINVSLRTFLENNVAAGDNEMHFIIWDKTEGTTMGVNSNYATITLNANVMLRDNEAPVNVMNMLHWTDKEDNSVYKDEDGNLKGHIELESDWVNAPVYNTSIEEYDADPKLSGTVIFDGTATDNSVVEKLTLSMSGLSSGNEIVFAQRDRDSSHATFGEFVGTTTLATDGIEFIEAESSFDNVTGKNTVTWKVAVDTAKISSVAATDVQVKAGAFDRGSPSINGANIVYANEKSQTLGTITDVTTAETPTGYYKVDVVPYITSIQTTNRKNSGLKDSNIRSASGKYSIIKGQSTDANASTFITINGYNFGASPTVKIVPTSSINTVTSTTGGTAVTATGVSSQKISVTNVLSNSGYLEVFTGTVRTLNNINDNNAHGSYVLKSNLKDYEQMPNREADYNTTKNVQLNDDRYLRVFDMKQTKVQNGYYPTMLMNGDNPVFGYVDNNGGPSSSVNNGGPGTDFSTNAHSQRAEFNATDGSEVYTEYLVKDIASDQMGMAVDEAGRYYNVSVYNYDSAGMALYYDRYNELNPSKTGDCWGPGMTYNTYSGTFAHSSDNNAIALETTYYNGELMLGRYQYPKLISKGNSVTGNAKVYMSYFDEKTKEICFRDFMIGKDLPTTATVSFEQAINYIGTGGGTPLYTVGGLSGLANKYVKINNTYCKLSLYSNTYPTYYKIQGYTTQSSVSSKIYSDTNGTEYFIEYSTALASRGSDSKNRTYEQKVNFVENVGIAPGSSGPSYYKEGRHSITTEGSKYFDMAVTSDNHVIIVYYDESNSKLIMKYSYGTVDGSNPTAAVAWTTSTISFPEYVGNYVSMTIDSANHIHIAAFDSGDSDLSYIYVPSYNATTCTAITVDQFASVGNWTQIKVNADNVPYIAYANATEYGQRDAIKLAYVAEGHDGTEAGVDSDGYTTGAWEYMTVPAITPPQGGDSKFQNVCLGFDTNGKPVVGYLGTNLEFGKWLDE